LFVSEPIYGREKQEYVDKQKLGSYSGRRGWGCDWEKIAGERKQLWNLMEMG
jgi:hypothetical protein